MMSMPLGDGNKQKSKIKKNGMKEKMMPMKNN